MANELHVWQGCICRPALPSMRDEMASGRQRQDTNSWQMDAPRPGRGRNGCPLSRPGVTVDWTVDCSVLPYCKLLYTDIPSSSQSYRYNGPILLLVERHTRAGRTAPDGGAVLQGFFLAGALNVLARAKKETSEMAEETAVFGNPHKISAGLWTRPGGRRSGSFLLKHGSARLLAATDDQRS
ncbi:uncharacterized protein TrAtP1_004253 [Trichoderma atroviride]|uniref:uncharacterized protein n=1 Tax=Hypocrea atroviridis TaxID=63577 RepID=UPI00331928B7|nr:hypothetical protein TrAtP1_004253 [Trichoderma atroviride]